MKKLLFIASTPYTGSTLLSILLGSHSEIGTVSQMVGPVQGLKASEYTCSCGDTLTECSFWAHVRECFEHLTGRGFDLENFKTRFYSGENRFVRNILYRSLYSDRLEAMRDSIMPKPIRHKIGIWLENNEALMDSVLKVSSTGHFLDASKDPVRIKYLSKLKGYELIVLHVVRDVRGFVNSSRKNNNRRVEKSAIRWMIRHREIERLVKEAGVRYKLIRYEDFACDPKASIAAICRFAGIEMCDRINFEPKAQHLLGNRMRLKNDFKIRLDESWKVELTEMQKTAAYYISKKAMSHYGYEQ